MRRRTFLPLAAAGGALPLLPGCLLTESRDAQAAGARVAGAVGTNLSGMEWTKPNMRRGASSTPNLHFMVPRRADIAWLAANGFKSNRLPILWEMLQPMLFDTRASAAVRALVGEPGEFNEHYAKAITDVLDAHAAAGAKCILDLHNYCRYQDFRFQPDGSVAGLGKPPTPLHRAFTEEREAIQERIFALAPGATLTQEHFTDFWTRAARRWKDHPGLAGYGLMNEPHDLPAPGRLVATEGGGEDLSIWPTYARAAVQAIRKVDPKTPIYVAGNEWSAAMSMATRNPGFPLPGDNLVYEVHLYLDAASNGHAFDWDTEVRKGFSAGVGNRPIDLDTGVKRLTPAVEWARAKGLRLALTEIGMPLGDPRWQEAFQRTVSHAVQNGVDVQSWMGGAHWPIRNYPIHHVPGWHQHRTLEPAVAGPLQRAAGVNRAALYDDGGGWAPPGQPVTITVYARGHLAQPLKLAVASDAGGRLSKTELTIPAGANGSDSYSFTPEPGRIATLRYTAAEGVQLPPPRKVYGVADAVALARDSLADAAHAILARYGAAKWEMAHGHTDFLPGAAPAQDGQPVRAVSDTGFASSMGNALEMLNFLNRDMQQPGPWQLPVMRTVQGRKALDVSAPDCWGLWCKKRAPMPGVLPNPRDRVPFDLQDEHFALVAIRVPGAQQHGIVFQASKAEDGWFSELALERGVPQARLRDARGQQVVLSAREPLPANRPVVLALTSAPGEQGLRVNGLDAARGAGRFAPSAFDQLLIGWGFVSHYPRDGFRGLVFGAIAGKGRPNEMELAVLERYLGSLAA
ncbi:MAG TPA: cellulase family glycosylhydrolase [Ramlibacter sp.]|nr:cellulase family glycosylhydrolase [Ramlibacter sp.]